MLSSFDSNNSKHVLGNGKGKVTSEWERKFVNINMLLKEKTRSRKLSKLYMD
jgi:hypothetical protein